MKEIPWPHLRIIASAVVSVIVMSALYENRLFMASPSSILSKDVERNSRTISGGQFLYIDYQTNIPVGLGNRMTGLVAVLAIARAFNRSVAVSGPYVIWKDFLSTTGLFQLMQ